MKKIEVDWKMKDIYSLGFMLLIVLLSFGYILWIEGGVLTWELWKDWGFTFAISWGVIWIFAMILQKFVVVSHSSFTKDEIQLQEESEEVH